MFRVTTTVRGSLEQYIEKEVKDTGMTKAQIMLNLAYTGKEYKEALAQLPELTQLMTQAARMNSAQETFALTE